MKTQTRATLATLLVLPSLAATAMAAPPPAPPAHSTAAPATPCGFVTFIPHGPPRVVDGTWYERVKLTVTFPDGHRETEELPYPWVYANGEQNDPWSDTNLAAHPSSAVPLQLPPSGTDLKAFSPLIRYVLQHTRPDGKTDLRECGTQHAAPASPSVSPAPPR